MISIPKNPNKVLNYKKVKYVDVVFRDKNELNEQKSRSRVLGVSTRRGMRGKFG